MTAYTSTQTGDWDDVDTWGGGGFPTTGDTAAISAGHTVSVKGAELCGNITVDPSGILRFDGQSDTVAAVMTLDNGSTITNNGVVDATGTGTTGPARIVGTSLEVMAGSDWDWAPQVWEIQNMDIQFDMVLDAAPAYSVTFNSALSTIADITIGAGGTADFTVADCTVGAATVSGGILLLEEAISFTSYAMASGTTTPAAAGTAIACSGNWIQSGGTFADGKGTLTLTGSGDLQHIARLSALVHSGTTTTTIVGQVDVKSAHTHLSTTTLSRTSGNFILGTMGAISGCVFPAGAVHNTGVVYVITFSSSSTADLAGSFANLTIKSDNGDTFTMGGALTTTGPLRIENTNGRNTVINTDAANDYAITVGGDFSFGADSGTLACNDSVVVVTGSVTIDDTSQLVTFTGSAGRLDVGSFVMTAGTCTPSAAGSDIQCSGNWAESGGTWTDNRGTLTLTASANLRHSVAGANRLAHLVHEAGVTSTLSTAVYLNTSHTLSATSHIDGSGTIIMYAAGGLTFPVGATMTGITYDLITNGGTLTAPGSFNNLQFRNTTAFTLGSTITCTGTLLIDDAVGGTDLDCATFALIITGVVTIDALATLDLGTSTGHIITADFTPLGDIDAAASTVTMGGDWDTSGITFTQGTSTVVFDGTGSTIDVVANSAGEGFYNFTLNAGKTATFNTNTGFLSNNQTITIGAGATLTIADGVTMYMSNAANTNLANSGTIESVSGAGTGIIGFRYTVNETISASTGTLNCNVTFIHFSGETESATMLGALTVGQDLIVSVSAGITTLDMATFALTVTGTTTINTSCSLDMGTSASHVLTGNVTIPGTLLGGSATATFGGTLNMNNGTFTRGTSTIDMTGGTGTLTVHTSAASFYNLTIGTQAITSPGFSASVSVFNAFNSSGTTTISSTNLQILGLAVTNFTSNALINGGSTSTIIFQLVGASRTLDNIGSITNLNVEFAGVSGSANTFTLGAALTLTTAGNLLVRNNGGTNSTLDAATFAVTIAGATNVNSPATLDLGTSGSHSFTGDVDVDGSLDMASATMTCAGNVDLIGGTITEGTGTLVMNATKNIDVTSAETLFNFTVSGAVTITLNVDGGSSFKITGAFTNTGGGTFDVDTEDLFIEGQTAIEAFDNSGGTITGSNKMRFRMSGTSSSLDNTGTITVTTLYVESTSGATNTLTLINDNFTTSGALIVRNNGGTNTTLDLDGFDTAIGTTTTIENGAFLDMGSLGNHAFTGDVDLFGTTNAASSTFTCTGNVDFTGGSFTQGSSTLVMNGAGKVLTETGVDLWNFTVSNTVSLSGVQLDVNNAFTNTSTFTAGTTFRIMNGGIAASDNSAGTITGAGTLEYKTSTAVARTLSNPGTVTIDNLIFDATAEDISLGENYSYTGTGPTTIEGANAFDTSTFDLSIAGTASVTGILQTGANGGGATWTFSNTVTVSGTAQITVTSGVFSLVLGSKTMSVRDQLIVADHASSGNAVFTTGGASHVDQRTALTGGQITMGRRVGWNGLYIKDCVIAQGTDMRGAWFGKGDVGVLRRTPSRSVQGIGPLGVRHG